MNYELLRDANVMQRKKKEKELICLGFEVTTEKVTIRQNVDYLFSLTQNVLHPITVVQNVLASRLSAKKEK